MPQFVTADIKKNLQIIIVYSMLVLLVDLLIKPLVSW